jgi:putative flippase GtrA
MPVSNPDVLCSVAAASIMVNAPTGSSGLMKRQVVLFIVIGVIQLGVDWLTFVVLTWSGMAVETANITSRIVGALLGFQLNGSITFRSPRQRSPQRIRQCARFAAGWTTTTALSTLAVWAIERGFGLHAVWIGKILIDGMLAVMGFVLSKYWIFR